MQIEKLPVSPRAVAVNQGLERALNRVVRTRDRLLERAHLGGRRARYDDLRYEFVGGASDTLRRKHYDKSLRLLWKAEAEAPWSSFRDQTEAERQLSDMALRALTPEERAARERLRGADFKALLDRTYTPRQKQAIVAILAAIGHGEAYAWLVSAALLGEVQSTGGKAALTAQVLEEAKHFVVMRELIEAFGVPVPRQSAWEYVLLEGILRARGVQKFFGMNVLVETIALSIFGLLAELPGLEILRLFHLDESRHTALPENYLREFPLTRWQRRSPLQRWRRLAMALPTLPLIGLLEEDLAELGVDAFDFGGSVLRKVVRLSERAGFDLPTPGPILLRDLNLVFNAYCRLTRKHHRFRDFMTADTTRDAQSAAVERTVFGSAPPPQ